MRKIPVSPPDLSQAEIDEVIKVLKSGWITTGPETKLFESRIAERCHTEKAVCLSSQTSCAELTLRILGIGPGDEVIVPAYTYTATASIVYHVGAKPVMVDCKSGSFEMDYDKMEAAINHNTKVIIPVDLAGVVCDYDRIFEAVSRFVLNMTLGLPLTVAALTATAIMLVIVYCTKIYIPPAGALTILSMIIPSESEKSNFFVHFASLA